ncbi:CocE/NonD family hydrolase [Chromohalobacter israelensis]|uniref:CocE/NonD family hydrolase n=1 Tax=Chromohalobacter israelensis TaxID=141390 RepID=UPI00265BD3B6|nr:CocE/NonD family hydrolase [Chromohalobacter salexigens]MDO0946874.1 CocE/NonD family hydrolase [Chromohalobacter salexigens]
MEYLADNSQYTVQDNIYIPMRDGTQLSARIWVPLVAWKTPVPAILEYIPYRKDDLTRKRDDMNHAFFASNGYACVRVDMRGCGASEGTLEDEYTLIEQEDGVDVISWMACQEWCDGNVGMMGISWGGFNSLIVASKQPRELKAIISLCASDDLYSDNMHYMGGCLLGDNLSEASVMFSFNTLPPDPDTAGENWRKMWRNRLENETPWIKKWLEHQYRDKYWSEHSLCEDYSSIKCPVYAVGGWADGFTNTVFRLLENLHVPCKGLIGPWGHKYPHEGVPGPAIDFLQEALRWWDYWLKGIDNGIMQEPQFHAWLQDSVPPSNSYSERPGQWVAESEWPTKNTSERILHLGKYTLHPHAQAHAEDEDDFLSIQSPGSVGISSGKWCSYTATPDLPGDQREDDGGSLVFETEPLEEDLSILGRPWIYLKIANNKPQGMLAVRISDVALDGKATRVTYGVINLTHRHNDESPSPTPINESFNIKIPLNGIAQTFPKNHKLRISISTTYWPLTWLPPEPHSVKVFYQSSYLVLPTLSVEKENFGSLSFGEPRGGKHLDTSKIFPGDHNWLIYRDLASKKWIMEVINDNGCFKINETGMEVKRSSKEKYSFIDDDFTSATGETLTCNSFTKGDWHTSVETRTVLTCSKEYFYIHATLDAHESNQRIFSNNWSYKIPRYNV